MSLQIIINGLALGSVYALIATGFSLIFNILKFSNFAHGALMTLSAFVGTFFSLYRLFISSGCHCFYACRRLIAISVNWLHLEKSHSAVHHPFIFLYRPSHWVHYMKALLPFGLVLIFIIIRVSLKVW